jgi:hypothetical protein
MQQQTWRRALGQSEEESLGNSQRVRTFSTVLCCCITDSIFSYEDAISNAALEYSDHATKELSEMEVFTGTIFNSTGVQTRRQRDGSIRLKDEFDRIARWTVSMIRESSQLSKLTEGSLALSIACLEVGNTKAQYASGMGMGRRKSELQSFRVIAACCALKELELASGE